MSALRRYVFAQHRFHSGAHYKRGPGVYANPGDGLGFPDLYRVGGPDSEGELLEMIPVEMARATSPAQPFNGYYFVDLTGDGKRSYDYRTDYGICAVPADYPRTGLYTFVIDPTGTAYYRDIGGKEFLTYPDPRWVLPCNEMPPDFVPSSGVEAGH